MTRQCALGTKAWPFLILMALLLACGARGGSDEPERPTASAIAADTDAGTCRTVTLTPGGASAKTVSPRMAFRIPQQIPVISGVARGCVAKLSFLENAKGTHATCTYSGPGRGSGAFTFSGCDSGETAGALSSATAFSLTVDRGSPFSICSGTFQVGLSISEPIDDGNPCTEDACSVTTEGLAATHGASVQGSVCSDGLVCNGAETCDGAGHCLAGTPLPLDSSNACTQNARCVEPTGLVADSIPGCGAPPTVKPIDGTVPANLADSSRFLYTGADPVQTIADPTVIDAARVSVVRGRVTHYVADPANKNIGPLGHVRVTVIGHPELGSTTTRDDGWFDLVVNGGEKLVVQFEVAGHLAVQRRASTRWQDYTVLPDVYMTPRSGVVTPVALGAPTLQVATGPQSVDSDGARTPLVMFPAGTSAKLTFSDGHSTPAPGTLSIHATEYTVGPTGAAAMPGDLPPSSAYTYALELGAVEADAAGASGIEFNQPVVFYVENFVGAEIGKPVPTGYYDRAKGVWVASESGQVVQVVSVANGQASLDAAAAPLGVSADELAQLARYAPGTSLWRVKLAHFSAWDLNWGYGLPAGAVAPDVSDPTGDDPLDSPCLRSGSIIECQNQILAEEIPIVGTPYSLRYQSERAKGRAIVLDIPITGAQPPPDALTRVYVNILVAGRRFVQVVNTHLPMQSMRWEWDRLDAYGRYVSGRSLVHVEIGYAYSAIRYGNPSVFAGAPASDALITMNRELRELVLWQHHEAVVGQFDAKGLGLGGWSLSPQHVYDSAAHTLYAGDGRRRNATAKTGVISTFAGNGTWATSGDGGAATAAATFALDVLAAPDGTVLIADRSAIRQVGRDGIIRTVAGGGTGTYDGDGGPAIGASVTPSGGLALGADGALYFSQGAAHQTQGVRKILNGTISTVIPAGTLGLRAPAGLAAAPDGSLYVASTETSTVLRRAPDGAMSIVAGGGTSGAPSYGEGGRATDAQLLAVSDLAIGPDGLLYIADRGTCRVRRVEPSGTLRTVVGAMFDANDQPSSTSCSANAQDWQDGVDARKAIFRSIGGLDVAPDGTIYVLDDLAWMVRAIGTDRVIRKVAGQGPSAAFTGDGGPGPLATLWHPQGSSFGADGTLYIADTFNARVRRVAPVLPGFALTNTLLPDESGEEVYVFDAHGRHLETWDPLRGSALEKLTYEPASGLLTSIKDRDGNVTTITRPSPSAIVIRAPFGQTTTLALDPNGYLASVTNPNNESTRLTHQDGLLTALVDPKQQKHEFGYDAYGLLIADAAPGSSPVVLARKPLLFGWATDFTTAENHTTHYTVTPIPPSSRASGTRYTVTSPSGARSTLDATDRGAHVATAANGAVVTTQLGPDPRFGMQTPIPASATTTTPGGVTMTVSETRTATLSNPANPFSVTNAVFTRQLNDAAYVTSVDMVNNQATTITPANRRVVAKLDPTRPTRVLQVTPFNLATVTYQYNDSPCATLQGHGCGGRLTSVTIDGGADGIRTEKYGYDSSPNSGLLSSITDSLDRTTTLLARDANGRIQAVQSPDKSTQVGFGYDLNGNVSTIVPPGKPAHAFGYTSADLLQTYAPPDLGFQSTQYSYNDDRQLTRITRPDGQVTITYDPRSGYVSSVTHPGDVLNFSYDSADQLTAITESTGGPGGAVGLSYTYDGPLLTSTTWTYGSFVGTPTVSRTYDNFFRLGSLTVGSTPQVGFQYDNDGILTRAGALGITPDPTTGLAIGSALGGVTDVTTPNAFGETKQSTAKYNGQVVYDVAYLRDGGGRISQKTETVGGQLTTLTYAYDPAFGWLTTDGAHPSVTLGYDSNGNRLTRNGTRIATYDAQDRLKSYVREDGQGSNSYSYTANGDLLTKSSFQGPTTYAYDLLGNLRSVVLPNGSTISYAVDGQDRRIAKFTNGSMVQGFLYLDSLRPAAELGANGSIARTFVYATRSNVPDYAIAGASTYRILSDHVGSPRLVINTATGNLAERIDYDAFGNRLPTSVICNAPAPPAPCAAQEVGYTALPIGFAGGLYDADTGLVRFGARDYDPEVGRWTTKDPIRFGGRGTSLYVYVNDDPINAIDPSGLVAVAPVPGPGLTVGQRYVLFSIAIAAAVGPQAVNTSRGKSRATCPSIPWTSTWSEKPTKDPVPQIDETGKFHGDTPRAVPDSWGPEDVRDAVDVITQSIEERKEELDRFGEDTEEGPGHRERIRREEEFLRKLRRKQE